MNLATQEFLMRVASLVGLVAVLSQTGCTAHTPVESAKLNDRVEELAQKSSTLQKQIEEMQNRLFLLEDKVDTSRVAIERSKPLQLPVVRLKPRPVENENEPGEESRTESSRTESSRTFKDEGDQADDEVEPGTEPVGGRSMVVKRPVLYQGEAARSGPRPVLKLHESGSGGSSSHGSTVTLGPDPSGVNEKLPVIPMPRRGSEASASAKGSATAGRAPAPSRSDVLPMQDYQSAMAKYRAGDYAAAAEAFKTFHHRYPQHAYADNALYWMAECSYDSKSYKVALKLFRQVVEQFPSGNKAPDALLKMGYCYVQLKDSKNARTILGQVLESYPRSQVAKLASEAMAKL
jgi:tol-pal system protein YbgF